MYNKQKKGNKVVGKFQARVRPELIVNVQGTNRLILPGQAAPLRDLHDHIQLGRMIYKVSGVMLHNGNVCSDGEVDLSAAELNHSIRDQYTYDELSAYNAGGEISGVRIFRNPMQLTVPGLWPVVSAAQMDRPYFDAATMSLPDLWEEIHRYGTKDGPFPRPFFGVEAGERGNTPLWDVQTERVVSVARLRCPFEAFPMESRGRTVSDLVRFARRFAEWAETHRVQRLFICLPGTPVERHAKSSDKDGRCAYTFPLKGSRGCQMTFLEGGSVETDHLYCLSGHWIDDRPMRSDVPTTRPCQEYDDEQLSNDGDDDEGGNRTEFGDWGFQPPPSPEVINDQTRLLFPKS